MKFKHQNFTSHVLRLHLMLFCLITSLALLAGQTMAQTPQENSKGCDEILRRVKATVEELERRKSDYAVVNVLGKPEAVTREYFKRVEETRLEFDQLIFDLTHCLCPEENRTTEKPPPTEEPRRGTSHPFKLEFNDVVIALSVIRENSDPNFNTYGFDTSYTRYINKHYGFTFDLNANFRKRDNVDLSKYSVLGGVTILPLNGAMTTDKVTIFTHALFGGTHFKADSGAASFTENSFTMKVGGGLDINVNKHLFIRPFEVNYAPTRFGGVWQHNLQINSGIGLRF